MDPTLTVVIPCFNDLEQLAESLPEALAIIGERLGRTISLLIMDGNSTDGTKAYLETMTTDGLTWVSEPDGGVYDAMNKSLGLVASDWVYFLGADDRLRAGFLDAANLLRDQGKVYYADVEMRSDGRRYDGAFGRYKLVFRNICHQSAFYPTTLIRRHRFCEDYRVYADWALNISLFSQYEFVHLDAVVAIYDDTGGISYRSEDASFEAARHRLCLQHLGFMAGALSVISGPLTKLYHLLRAARLTR